MRITSSADQQKIDWDGLTMLSLSILSIILSGGLLWFLHFLHIYRTAKESPHTPHSSKTTSWILFGKQLKSNQIDTDYRQRLKTILRLSPLIDKQTSIFLLGGITTPNNTSEARAALKFLLKKAPKLSENLILEEQSRNTLENLKQARTALKKENKTLDVHLITNRYHLHRCQTIADQLGFNVQLIAAEIKWELNFRNILKLAEEAFFLNWYYTATFTSKLFKNQRMLNKIH